jgi:predicted transposase YdaD
LVAALFRLENTRTEKDEKAIAQAIQKILVLLIDWLKEPELADLRRDIETWLLRVLLPTNVPNEKIPQVTGLQEMNQMLYETIQGLYRDAEARGKAEGKAEGKAQGKAEGKAEGITEGQAGMLIQLLEDRFGPLTPYQKTKIKRFDEKTLFSCYQRLFTAKSVQEVIRQRR